MILHGNTKWNQDIEIEQRYQLLLDRIQARRIEVAEKLSQAIQEAKEGEPYPEKPLSGISREGVKSAQETFKSMEELDIVEMERDVQCPESPRRKKEQSENSKNKKQHIKEDTQKRDIAYSDKEIHPIFLEEEEEDSDDEDIPTLGERVFDEEESYSGEEVEAFSDEEDDFDSDIYDDADHDSDSDYSDTISVHTTR